MSIIVVDEITPSCPMFLAITKQLTVVAEPSITRIAISSLSLNPKATAIGRNTATNYADSTKSALEGKISFRWRGAAPAEPLRSLAGCARGCRTSQLRSYKVTT